MDAQAGLGSEDSQVLREQIYRTQLELGQKLGALEGEVRGVTAQAKEAIQERLAAVRDVVDVRQHVVRHPFVWGAVAFGSGVWVARRTGRRRVDRTKPPAGWVREMAAPHFRSLQTILVGRAISFVADRLREALMGRAAEPPSRGEPD